MESLISLLSTLNNLSPLALASLLGLVLFYQARNDKRVTAIRTNHLHELPEMAETLRRIEEKLTTGLAVISAKLDTIE